MKVSKEYKTLLIEGCKRNLEQISISIIIHLAMIFVGLFLSIYTFSFYFIIFPIMISIFLVPKLHNYIDEVRRYSFLESLEINEVSEK